MRLSASNRWFALPQRITNELDRAGVSAAGRALLFAAWDFSATELTDGILTASELRRLPGHTPKLVEALTGADWLIPVPGGVSLSGFLEVNWPRARVEKHRLQQREKASLGGRTTGAGRDAQGRFAPPGTEPPGRFASRSRSTEPDTEYLYQHPYQNNDGTHHRESPHDGHPRGAGRAELAQAAEWDGFGPEWEHFRAAWVARGFRHPPTEKQRKVLWPIVDNRPEDAGAWVRAAQGPKAADVVGDVLAAWDTYRRDKRASGVGE